MTDWVAMGIVNVRNVPPLFDWPADTEHVVNMADPEMQRLAENGLIVILDTELQAQVPVIVAKPNGPCGCRK